MVFGSFEQGVNFLLALDYNKLFFICKPYLIIFIKFILLYQKFNFLHNITGDYMYYVNYFFIFSILGHFIETFFYSNGESGILISYWTPIYGIGVIIILLINKFIEKLKVNKFIKIILLFFICSIGLAVIEFIGGCLIKWIFHTELWDYSNHKLNIGKYTSIEMSLIWGMSGILVIYFLKPLIDKIVYKIPKILSYMLITLFVIDLFLTLLTKH